MDYYDGLSEKEIHYIDEARIIGRTEGNSKRLSDLIKLSPLSRTF